MFYGADNKVASVNHVLVSHEDSRFRVSRSSDRAYLDLIIVGFVANAIVTVVGSFVWQHENVRHISAGIAFFCYADSRGHNLIELAVAPDKELNVFFCSNKVS